jgi:hypothetical protein
MRFLYISSGGKPPLDNSAEEKKMDQTEHLTNESKGSKNLGSLEAALLEVDGAEVSSELGVESIVEFGLDDSQIFGIDGAGLTITSK